jgi:biopolymer transport protein ExbB
MDFLNHIVKFISDGGIWMWPIMTAGAVGIGIFFERYILLSSITKQNKKIWDQLHPVLVAGEFDKARKIIDGDNSTISRLLSLGLALQGAVRRRDDLEVGMEEGLMEVMPKLEKRTHYISLLANIATLLGLLGTVMGLIAAFTAVAHAAPAEKADLLAAAISVGMNCTAFGLLFGIPLMILHSYIISMTSGVVASLEMASFKTINLITASAKRIGPERAAA